MKYPIPHSFFAVRHDITPLASQKVLLPISVAVHVVLVAVFSAQIVYHKSPEQGRLEVTVDREYTFANNTEGKTCEPLQPDKRHGLSWTYETCLENFQPPSLSSVHLVTADADLNAVQREAYFICSSAPPYGITAPNTLARYFPFGIEVSAESHYSGDDIAFDADEYLQSQRSNSDLASAMEGCYMTESLSSTENTWFNKNDGRSTANPAFAPTDTPGQFPSKACYTVHNSEERESFFSCAIDELGTGCDDALPFILECIKREQITAEQVCKPFAENPPYTCQKRVSKGMLEVISLSVANTELVFVLITGIVAALLEKAKKKVEVSVEPRVVVTEPEE